MFTYPHGNATNLCRGLPLLGQARFHRLRRTDRPDCDYAQRVGREEKVDWRITLLARAELLHALTGAGSAATGYLRRLAIARHVGRNRGWGVLCDSVDFHSAGAELGVCGARQHPVDRRRFLRIEA